MRANIPFNSVSDYTREPSKGVIVCVCVCFLAIETRTQAHFTSV